MIEKCWPIALIMGITVACTGDLPKKTLPVLGNKEIINGDTIFATIRDFTFINQDGDTVDNSTFANKIYIADFFFTHCPTICPKVKKQMLRIQDHFDGEERLKMISHTVDPKRDTVGRLKEYAAFVGVNTQQWMLVTGEKDSLYEIAEDYFSVATENPEAPGGFDHSGRLILVDTRRRVRSFCDGTDPEAVDDFMKDVELLLKR